LGTPTKNPGFCRGFLLGAANKRRSPPWVASDVMVGLTSWTVVVGLGIAALELSQLWPARSLPERHASKADKEDGPVL